MHIRLPLAAIVSCAVALGAAGCDRGGKPRPDLLFVSTRDGVYALYEMDADGRRQRRFSSEPLPAATAANGLFYETDPSWSPDGTRVAFASNRSGRSEIYVAPANGGSPRRLTSELGGASRPSWSRRGTIAYVRSEPGSIYVVPARGGAGRRLGRDHAQRGDPAWSPDGRLLAFARRAPGGPITEIWVMRADGSAARRVTSLGAVAASPSWSPDGRRIAFTANRAGNFDLYVVGVDGRGVRRLTKSPSDDLEPAWSPDGRFIAFSREGAIYTLELSGREHRLTSGHDNDSSPAWNPVPQGEERK